MLVTLANVLTMYRFSVGWLVYFGLPAFSGYMLNVLIITAAISDFLDGLLARALGQESRFGKVFDPLADASFLLSLLLLVYNMGFVPLWFMTFLLFRYACICSYFYLIGDKRVNWSVPWSGKVAVFFLMFFLVLQVGLLPYGINQDYSHDVLWLLIALPMVWSLVDYTKQFVLHKAIFTES